jgi:hypothetical protein
MNDLENHVALAAEQTSDGRSSTSAHTPGPWRYCDCQSKCLSVNCSDHPIARVVGGEWGDEYPAIRLVGTSSMDMRAEPYLAKAGYGRVDMDEAEANARLIAAAPDLLACLRHLVTLDDAQQAPSPQTMNEARAAIAKATGGA